MSLTKHSWKDGEKTVTKQQESTQMGSKTLTEQLEKHQVQMQGLKKWFLSSSERQVSQTKPQKPPQGSTTAMSTRTPTDTDNPKPERSWWARAVCGSANLRQSLSGQTAQQSCS